MSEIPALIKLANALNPLPGAAVDIGPYAITITGSVNTPGGSGGTSMIDNNPFTPGNTAITPIGGYFGPRTISSGNAAAPALSNSAILLVDVRAGGAGGGVANITVRGTGNSDIHVGVASGQGFNQDGGAPLPILGTVNVVGGGGSALGTVGVYGSVGVFGSVAVFGSAAFQGLGGSIGVTQITSPWVTTGSVQVTQGTLPLPVVGSVNISGGVQASLAAITVRGSANTDLHVGYASGAGVNVDGGAYLPVLFQTGNIPSVAVYGSLGAVGLGGSLGVTQISNPWIVTGSVNAVMGTLPLPITTASFMYADSTNSAIRVNVVAGGAGGGGVFGSVGVYGSVSVTGSVNVAGSLLVGAIAPAGSINVYGSVNITGSINPVGIFGSVGVYGSVNIIAGSLNVINVTKVDTSASLSPTMWPISTAVSGNLTVIPAGSLSSNVGNNQIKVYAITLVSEQTANMIWQSPSGTNISGSLQLLPGAGFVVTGAIRNPILIAGAGGSVNINSSGTGHLGGWAMGYVE